jgi:hypothetical protein
MDPPTGALSLSGLTFDRPYRTSILYFQHIRTGQRSGAPHVTHTVVVAEAISWHLQRNGCTKSKMESFIYKLENHGHNEQTRSGSAQIL